MKKKLQLFFFACFYIICTDLEYLYFHFVLGVCQTYFTNLQLSTTGFYLWSALLDF